MKTASERRVQTGLLGMIATCCSCEWRQEKSNALPLAAQHHDRTGHQVHVQITRVVVYGGTDK